MRADKPRTRAAPVVTTETYVLVALARAPSSSTSDVMRLVIFMSEMRAGFTHMNHARQVLDRMEDLGAIASKERGDDGRRTVEWTLTKEGERELVRRRTHLRALLQ